MFVPMNDQVATDLSDAEQDFGSDYGGGDDEEDQEEEIDTNNLVNLRSREWSSKQYSVSSNNDEEDQIDAEEGLGISPGGLKDYNSDDEEEDKDECYPQGGDQDSDDE